MPILLAMEGAVSQGVLWGLMTLGVYLTFRILKNYLANYLFKKCYYYV